MTVRSEIQVPTDYTETSFTTISGEFDFVIKVRSCIVTSYAASQVLTTFSYNIGAPGVTSDKYIFDEDQPCDYAETVTISNLPAFMEHNEATSDFSIAQNSDLSLIGSYTVTIKSQITIPNDPTPTILED